MQPSVVPSGTEHVEQKRFVVMEAVARSVMGSLEPKRISEAAVTAIRENFETLSVYVYRANPKHRMLYLLHVSPPPVTTHCQRSVERIAYDGQLLVSTAHQQRTPIIIEDLEVAAQKGRIEANHPLLLFGARGYICVPLWFGEQFEGALAALFDKPVTVGGAEEQVLVGCSFYLAAALAHGRMHTTVAQERLRLRTVLDQVPEGIIIADSSTGVINYANTMAEQLLGLPFAELVNIPLYASPQTPSPTSTTGSPTYSWVYALIRAFCGETVNGMECVVTRPDGSSRFTLCSSAPLRTTRGDMAEAILVFQDISAKVSLEQHKNAFISMASHELKTPITVIQGFADLLLEQAEGGKTLNDPTIKRVLSTIVSQSDALTHLVEEMLDLSHIEHAQLTLTYGTHDLIQTLAAVVETLASTTSFHHIYLKVEGKQEGEPLQGCFDERRVVQIFHNLICNAIKYSPNGGEIEVGLRWQESEPDQALLWVRDGGIGIPAQELPHIFKRFHRASLLDPSFTGLGIGLYIVKDLVVRHHGRIWVESKEGQGSTFFIVLPLDKCPFS